MDEKLARAARADDLRFEAVGKAVARLAADGVHRQDRSHFEAREPTVHADGGPLAAPDRARNHAADSVLWIVQNDDSGNKARDDAEAVDKVNYQRDRTR